jgi:hypothetical protein
MLTLTPEQRRAAWWQGVRSAWPVFVFVALIIASAVLVNFWAASYDRAGTPAQDEAAKERARQFLRELELEPGPVVCRSARTGSAWCTIREAHGERFWQVFCSFRHPSCIQNTVRINP